MRRDWAPVVSAAFAVLVLAVCSVLFVQLLAQVSPSNRATAAVLRLGVGQNALLVRANAAHVLLALDEATFHTLRVVLLASDAEGLTQTLQAQTVLQVAVGTRAHVLEQQANATKVRVLEGLHRGQEGWLNPDWVR